LGTGIGVLQEANLAHTGTARISLFYRDGVVRAHARETPAGPPGTPTGTHFTGTLTGGTGAFHDARGHITGLLHARACDLCADPHLTLSLNGHSDPRREVPRRMRVDTTLLARTWIDDGAYLGFLEGLLGEGVIEIQREQNPTRELITLYYPRGSIEASARIASSTPLGHIAATITSATGAFTGLHGTMTTDLPPQYSYIGVAPPTILPLTVSAQS
jgi:hypothetical protein